ncbi:hypothetical protein LINPERPRIM_LOCUS30494, partial [Linum perenne]
RTTRGAQPGIKSALASKDVIHTAHLLIAKWFYDCCIPFHATRSPYFQQSFTATCAIGPRFKVPSYHDIRVPLISDCKRQCELLVKTFRTDWAERGCILMADCWTDRRGRTLINFLVYCSRGLCFLKYVDASKMTKDAPNLFKLFDEVLKWIGTDNVFHVVTYNAANYKACGKIIHNTYPHIYWFPCAAHCLNLILKDFASLDHIAKLFDKASKITVFVYNHQKILNWLKERPNWKEIVRPGATRFVTHFITLNSIHEHKLDLQLLVVSEFFNFDEPGKVERVRMCVPSFLMEIFGVIDWR